MLLLWADLGGCSMGLDSRSSLVCNGCERIDGEAYELPA